MKRLYVLIRADLGPSYGAVQAGHAVGQFMLDYPGKWKNEYLIYLSVLDIEELEKWRLRLENQGH